jgi:hypothetical protein
MPTPKSKLSKFILSLPASLTGSQVVERAKARGMKTSRANVSRVRGLYGPKAVKTSATVTSPASKAEAAKSTAVPSSSPHRNKSDFIRAQPTTMSAAEVIAKGKAEGIQIGNSLVYMVRSRSTRKAKRAATKTTAAPSKPARSKAAFVRAHRDLSTKDLVGKALFDGIDRTENYVYKVRGQDKVAAAKKKVVREDDDVEPLGRERRHALGRVTRNDLVLRRRRPPRRRRGAGVGPSGGDTSRGAGEGAGGDRGVNGRKPGSPNGQHFLKSWVNKNWVVDCTPDPPFGSRTSGAPEPVDWVALHWK